MNMRNTQTDTQKSKDRQSNRLTDRPTLLVDSSMLRMGVGLWRIKGKMDGFRNLLHYTKTYEIVK